MGGYLAGPYRQERAAPERAEAGPALEQHQARFVSEIQRSREGLRPRQRHRSDATGGLVCGCPAGYAYSAVRRIGLVALLLGCLLPSQGAQAAFPGDNGKIAYTVNKDLDVNDVCTRNVDGTGRLCFSGVNESAQKPSWSPDGTRLAYEDFGVYIANPDGSAATSLPTTAEAYEPAWSPDGTKIAHRFQGVLYVIDADGTDRVPNRKRMARSRAGRRTDPGSHSPPSPLPAAGTKSSRYDQTGRISPG